MMLSEHHRSNPNPTIHMPPWSVKEDPTADIYSSYYQEDNNNNNACAGDFAGDYSPYHLREALAALQSYLPSNEIDGDSDSDAPVDAYSCDHFRMYEFKVRRCARGRSHDWTECPYAHPGEKARRRDPRKFHYSGAACPDFRKGNCKKGDGCEFAHGVFECWLHPARYRTQPCKDGTSCRRRVCFFAHTPEQLRQAPPPSQLSPRCINSPDSYDGSPLRQISVPFMSSPANCAVSVSLSPPMSPSAESPPMSPMSPMLSRSLGSPVNEMVVSLRNLQLGKVKSLPTNRNVSIGSPGFGSPRGSGSVLRPGFCSLPNTPTQAPGSGRAGVGYFDLWDQTCEEEPMMERVESGRDIRAKMFEKLSKDNSLGSSDPDPDPGLGGAPDFEWVSDLVT